MGFTAPSGERIQRFTGTSDKFQAQELEDRLKAQLWRVFHLGEKPRRSWQDAVARWLLDTDHKADHEKDKAKIQWLDTYLGHLWLDEITRDTIDEIARIKKKEASGSTANRYLALIRSILRMAHDEWEWIDRVPRVRMFKEPKKRIRWITREEATRLLNELPEHLADMAEFSLATGLRQRNVSFLRWDQLDLERKTAWIYADESKNGRDIRVPLNDDAIAVLYRRHGYYREYVFTFRDKPVLRTSTKAWKAALARAGIEDFRWHDLRHTWASWHVQAGTSLQELQELGGWSSFEMVLRYAHLSSEHLLPAAQRISATKLLLPTKKGGLKLVVSR